MLFLFQPIHHAAHTHPGLKLKEKEPCPAHFAYLYPENTSGDSKRWISAFTRGKQTCSETLHNHRDHGSSKVCSKVRQMISNAVELS